jgi:hypothetical protein
MDMNIHPIFEIDAELLPRRRPMAALSRKIKGLNKTHRYRAEALVRSRAFLRPVSDRGIDAIKFSLQI